MERAQKRNACLAEKFYFRENVTDFEDAKVREMDINEIINGSDLFKGLLFYIREYLKTTSMTEETKLKIESYLNVFQLRASGVLKTPASWIRNFVMNHESYKQDSIVNGEINYDLMWKIYQMSSRNVVFDLEGNKLKLDE